MKNKQHSDTIQNMKIYLDVCCLNRPFDDQTQDRVHLEAEAILSILSHCKTAGWDLIGSEVIDYEISNMPDEDKRFMVNALSSLRRSYIKIDADIERRAFGLEKIGFQPFDALHAACAEKAGADIFLTTDDSLLRKSTQSKKALKVKVENPLRWVMEVFK